MWCSVLVMLGCCVVAGLDIAAMMEAWLVDVGAVCRYIKYLAGLPESPVRSTAHSSLGGSPRPDVTPLVATGDASSHAPHLYAQLALHQKSLDQMKGLRTEMGARMAATGEGASLIAVPPLPAGCLSYKQRVWITALVSAPVGKAHSILHACYLLTTPDG